MGILEIIGGILLIIVSVTVVITVSLQEQKGSGVNALSGGSSDSYIEKNKTRTHDSTLAMISKYSGITLFVVTIGVLLIEIYAK